MLTPIDMSVVWGNSNTVWACGKALPAQHSTVLWVVRVPHAVEKGVENPEVSGPLHTTTLYISLALGHALVELEALQLYSSETPLQLYSSTPLYSIHPLQHPS